LGLVGAVAVARIESWKTDVEMRVPAEEVRMFEQCAGAARGAGHCADGRARCVLLHISSAPDQANNFLALAFGVFVTGLRLGFPRYTI
jgi:hypothetical protein